MRSRRRPCWTIKCPVSGTTYRTTDPSWARHALAGGYRLVRFNLVPA